MTAPCAAHRTGLPDLSGPYIPRAWDERILKVLRMNAEGVTRKEIAAALGIGLGAVNGMIDRVKAADLAESGKPSGRVRAHYLKRARRP